MVWLISYKNIWFIVAQAPRLLVLAKLKRHMQARSPALQMRLSHCAYFCKKMLLKIHLTKKLIIWFRCKAHHTQKLECTCSK